MGSVRARTGKGDAGAVDSSVASVGAAAMTSGASTMTDGTDAVTCSARL